MADITHLVLLFGEAGMSFRLVDFDGELDPTTRQIREAFALSDETKFRILDLRKQESIWISATGKPDGLQHCSTRDLGAQLDMWTKDRFSPIYHLSTELLQGNTPKIHNVIGACEDLREIEPMVGEILEEEAEFAHELADELERRFSQSFSNIEGDSLRRTGSQPYDQ